MADLGNGWRAPEIGPCLAPDFGERPCRCGNAKKATVKYLTLFSVQILFAPTRPRKFCKNTLRRKSKKIKDWAISMWANAKACREPSAAWINPKRRCFMNTVFREENHWLILKKE